MTHESDEPQSRDFIIASQTVYGPVCQWNISPLIFDSDVIYTYQI